MCIQGPDNIVHIIKAGKTCTGQHSCISFDYVCGSHDIDIVMVHGFIINHKNTPLYEFGDSATIRRNRMSIVKAVMTLIIFSFVTLPAAVRKFLSFSRHYCQ